MQTVALAEKVIAVKYGPHGFDADALMAAVGTLDTSQCIGFVYGSGFEAEPELLAQLAVRLPLIGNNPHVVAAVKSPAVFFAALQLLHIRYPQVSYSVTVSEAEHYLLKFGGGSGGTHVRVASADDGLAPSNHYFQQKIAGQAVSLLFLADGRAMTVIGFNEQWLNPSIEAPFRYGGAVSHAALTQSVKTQLADAAGKLTQTFGLLGLNSLDAIATEDNQVFVLEINPRLSATIDLYQHMHPDLLQRHVQACLGEKALNLPDADVQKRRSRAHAIVYAAADITLAAALPWPEWVVDIPPLSRLLIKIKIGEPICTVLAEADDAQTAKKLAQRRVEIVENLLQSKQE